MSALSEIDLKDFEKINVDLLETTLKDADLHFEYPMLFNIDEYCNTLRRLQKKLIKQTPTLLKP
jgi:hypothetical protein